MISTCQLTIINLYEWPSHITNEESECEYNDEYRSKKRTRFKNNKIFFK